MKRYEKEIRDLLESLDTFVPETPPADKDRTREREPEREPRKRAVGVIPPQPPIPIRVRKSPFQRFSQWLTGIKIGTGMRFMLSGLFLVIAALILNQNFPSLIIVAQIVGAVGGMLFLMPAILRFINGKEVDADSPTWRGREVESDNFNWTSFKKLFGKRGKKGNDKDPWNKNRW